MASSGLVDGLVLHRVATEVAVNRPGSPTEQDEQYARKLIELGLVNAWQIDQLRQGRTKFTLGPYRIINAIGRGGMGYVFLGEHELLGRVEAIKVLPKVKTSPETIANFRHEIRSQARLDHPNLVRVSYADRDGETYFLVTEYVPGIDLRRLIRRLGPLDESVAAWVVSEAARGVHYAHQNQLVHRDVKPGNLLLTNGGRVKVTDLGLAWCLDGGPSLSSPSIGKIVGTSDYLAPETIRDPNQVSPVSDVYSLGCTLYYAITGKVPYPGGTHLNKMKRHLKERPADPRRFNPDLDPDFVRLVESMMQKDPEQRAASASIVAEALAARLHGDEARRLAPLVAEAVAKADNDFENNSPGGSSSDEEAEIALPETIAVTVGPGSEATPTALPEKFFGDEPNARASVAEAPPATQPLSQKLYWVAGAALALAAGLAAAFLL